MIKYASTHWWVHRKFLNAAFFRTSENPLFANRCLSLTAAAANAGGSFGSVTLVRLSFTGAKLRQLDRVTLVRDGGWDMDGGRLENLLSKAEFAPRKLSF